MTHSSASINAVTSPVLAGCIHHPPCSMTYLDLKALASATVTSVVLADEATKCARGKAPKNREMAVMKPNMDGWLYCYTDTYLIYNTYSTSVYHSISQYITVYNDIIIILQGIGKVSSQNRYQLAGRCLELSMSCSQWGEETLWRQTMRKKWKATRGAEASLLLLGEDRVAE